MKARQDDRSLSRARRWSGVGKDQFGEFTYDELGFELVSLPIAPIGDRWRFIRRHIAQAAAKRHHSDQRDIL
jgi:predicted ATPase